MDQTSRHVPRRGGRRSLAALAVACTFTIMSTTLLAAEPAVAALTPVGGGYRHLCDEPAEGQMACLALVSTQRDGRQPTVTPRAAPPGYGPADLRSAYGLTATGSSSATVAIVDAFNDPNAESDLALYRSQFALPSCTTANGCFRKVSQTGTTSYPADDAGWSGEISLDLDMASAICPGCHILLVEATSNYLSDLGTAVNEAVALGAKYVSNSYGGPESSGQTAVESSYFNHPGVAITVSAGDSDYGAEFPATSRYVTAVGGTSLTKASNARGWSETTWQTDSTEGTGSGCSAYISKPAWQTDSGCSRRMEADVSAVADPNTGVAVYNTFQATGWYIYGGTSVSAPIIASVYALAGTPGAADYPAKYPYQHTGALWDVVTGSNGTCTPAYFCTATTGYDGPTGWGTPHGTSAFAATAGNIVTVNNPGNRASVVGTAVSLQISATDSGSGALTYTATGLPAGLAISSSTGLISGTPTTAGTYAISVKATDSTGASGAMSFTWTINPAGSGTSITNGGFETGTTSGWTTVGTVSVLAAAKHSGSYGLRLGSPTPGNDSTAAQTFTAAAGTSALSFYYNVICPDTVDYDWAQATLADVTAGTSATVLANTCVANSGWVKVTTRVTAGHKYTLTLRNHDDNYPTDPTYTYFDDVTVS